MSKLKQIFLWDCFPNYPSFFLLFPTLSRRDKSVTRPCGAGGDCRGDLLICGPSLSDLDDNYIVNCVGCLSDWDKKNFWNIFTFEKSLYMLSENMVMVETISGIAPTIKKKKNCW